MNTRHIVLASILIAGLGVAVSVAQVEQRAQSAAQGVHDVLGTEKGLQQNGFEPLSTEQPMRTMDGRTFDAQMGCRATRQFLRVTVFPSGASDIDTFSVELDRDLDGRTDSVTNYPGPFAAVCNNGLISCDPGTFNNCRHFRYRENAGVIELEPVTIRELGACYCVNASCGNNLLMINSQKIVADVAAGIVQALRSVQPRLTAARALTLDPLTVAYYGQEAGCGQDRTPEQYFSRPNELASAGVTAAAQPGTVANFMLGTSIASQHNFTTLNCEVRRVIETANYPKHDILRLVSSTRGAVTDCGTGCLRFRLGDAVGNLYGGGSGGTRCRISSESQQYLVGYPDRIDSVVLRSADFDDAIRLRIGSTLAHNSLPTWIAPGTPEFRCDYGNHSISPNTNLLGFFSTPGSVTLQMEIAHDRRGEGWYEIEARVREGCEITREDVVDGCVAAAANPDCSLESEIVDGVQTVQQSMTTGLGPLASSRAVGTACQVDSGARSWWLTQRTYRCRTAPRSYDLSAAEDRYRSIHDSFDGTTGNFTDRRVTASGAQLFSENMTLPRAVDSTGCIPMCRVRKPRPGAEVGDLAAPTTRLNATGIAYDFKFKECDAARTCPVEPGEEIVAPCDCRSNFAQAAALMQTIRMVGKDMVCTAPSQP